MRKLQHIFTVLISNNILEWDPQAEVYIAHRDPFIISDEEWDTMCEEG